MILSRRGYVLAETKDFYGIWQGVAEGEPLERFPLTLEGFEAAEERLRELVRLKRQKRGFTAALLWRIVVFGGSMWILAGLAVAVLSVYSSSSFVSRPVFQFAFFADSWAYRLAVGGLIMLSALLLVRLERRARKADGPTSIRSFLRLRDQPEPSPATWEVVLRWTLVVGLVAWILSAVATQGLFAEPDPLIITPGEPVGQRFSSGFVVSRLVEAFAFRVWVTALVLLAVRWGRRWTQPEETGPEELISAR